MILIYLQKHMTLLFIITKTATTFIIEYNWPLTSKTFRSIDTYFWQKWLNCVYLAIMFYINNIKIFFPIYYFLGFDCKKHLADISDS